MIIFFPHNLMTSHEVLLESESKSEVPQSCLTLCDPMVYQAPPSMGFSRQQCWSGLPFPSPADLPYPGIEPRSPALQVDSLPAEPPGKPKEWNGTKVMRKNNLQSRILYLARLSFRSDGEIKSFTDKQKL